MRNFITAGLLLCFLASSVLSDIQNECLKYKAYLDNNFVVNNKTKNLLKVEFDVLVRPYKRVPNTYTFDFQKPKGAIARENGKLINLNECPASLSPISTFFQPTLFSYDRQGLLTNIKVSKKQPAFAINYQLFTAALFQVNFNALQETKHPMKTDKSELTTVGECPVTYQVFKDYENYEENFHVIKNYNINECSEIKHQLKNQQNHATSEYLFTRQRGRVIPQEIFLTGTVYLEHGVRIDADVKYFLEETSSCTKTPPFIHTNDIIDVKKSPIHPVNEKLMEESKETGKEDLVTIYKGLTKGGIMSNMYLEVYERALKCWDVDA